MSTITIASIAIIIGFRVEALFLTAGIRKPQANHKSQPSLIGISVSDSRTEVSGAGGA